MLVEIPDLDVIFGLILAFIGGLFTLFVYSKLKSISASNEQTKQDSERLEFYERQLIDLKIKLDAIDLENLSFSQETPQNIVKNEEKPVQVVEKQVQVVPEQVPVPARVERTPNMSSGDIVEAVLRLITDRSRTSRDIQITLGKSREHISRTMKKLFETVGKGLTKATGMAVTTAGAVLGGPYFIAKVATNPKHVNKLLAINSLGPGKELRKTKLASILINDVIDQIYNDADNLNEGQEAERRIRSVQ